MAVDKNLFLYDLAVVAMLKNEGHYVKEWLDYHILAGVEHFYIYDHESYDNQREVLQPYIDAGIVTCIVYPEKVKMMEAYMEAVKTYRFFCRYMAFLDGDEFIFPQENKSIVEIVDEILADKKNIGGLEIQWMVYGSNFLETADYSKGVLERFTRRANQLHLSVKTVANPRTINYITTPHYMAYFADFERHNDFVTENSNIAEKIIINHYQMKSREEFLAKVSIGIEACYGSKKYYVEKRFAHEKDNDVFDDSILRYREARLQLGKDKINTVDYEKVIAALIENLLPILTGQNTDPNFFEGKMETVLTCRALSTYLKENILGEERGKILEEASLHALYQTLLTHPTWTDMELLLNELPNILTLNYPIVKNILKGCVTIIPQMKRKISEAIDNYKKFDSWRVYNDFDNLYRILKVFESYEHK